MKILAIDFSSPQRSVAVLHGETRVEVVETNALTASPLEMIEEALKGARLERNQIECLTVGLGPGSYTGIRSALALAQGWQLAGRVKLQGISSAEAVAAQAGNDGIQGRVNVVIDAQRGEFYLAVYELGAGTCEEVSPLKIVSLEEMRRLEQAGEILAGPEVTRWFEKGRLTFPRAAMLAELSMARTDFMSGEKLEPIYLRETTFVKAPPSRIIPTR